MSARSGNKIPPLGESPREWCSRCWLAGAATAARRWLALSAAPPPPDRRAKPEADFPGGAPFCDQPPPGEWTASASGRLWLARLLAPPAAATCAVRAPRHPPPQPAVTWLNPPSTCSHRSKRPRITKSTIAPRRLSPVEKSPVRARPRGKPSPAWFTWLYCPEECDPLECARDLRSLPWSKRVWFRSCPVCAGGRFGCWRAVEISRPKVVDPSSPSKAAAASCGPAFSWRYAWRHAC